MRAKLSALIGPTPGISARRDQPHPASQCHQNTAPVMRAATCLQNHFRPWQLGKEPLQLLATQLPAQHHLYGRPPMLALHDPTSGTRCRGAVQTNTSWRSAASASQKIKPNSTRLPSAKGRGGGYRSLSRVGKCAAVAWLEPRRGQATELGGDPALHAGANSTRAKPAL